MDLLLFLIIFAAGIFFFALISRKWGYRIGAGMARKRMKDLGLTDEDKEAHE
jgi:hypothetical protein